MRNLGIVVIILVLAALGWFLLQGQGNEPTVVEAPAAVEVPAVEVEEVVEEKPSSKPCLIRLMRSIQVSR